MLGYRIKNCDPLGVISFWVVAVVVVIVVVVVVVVVMLSLFHFGTDVLCQW